MLIVVCYCSSEHAHLCARRLKSPRCYVRYVAIAVYRALFQAGHPLYPPLRLRVEVGPSPSTLQPASPW
jgi:hypothetical protein